MGCSLFPKSAKHIKSFFKEVLIDININSEDILYEYEILNILKIKLSNWLSERNINESDIKSEIQHFTNQDWLDLIVFCADRGFYCHANFIYEYNSFECDNSITYCKLLREKILLKTYDNQFDLAIQTGIQALNIAYILPEDNSDLIANIHLALSFAYQRIGNFKDSLKELETALVKNKNISKNIFLEIFSNLIIAFINAGCDDYNKQTAFIEKGNRILEQLGGKENAGKESIAFFAALGGWSTYQKDFESAIKHYTTTIALAKKHELNCNVYFSHLLHRLAVAHTYQGLKHENNSTIQTQHYENAEELFVQSINLLGMITGSTNTYEILQIRCDLGELYIHKRDLLKAKEEFINIVQIANELLEYRPKDEVFISKIYNFAKDKIIEINDLQNSLNNK